jgi:hypothetical protein
MRVVIQHTVSRRDGVLKHTLLAQTFLRCSPSSQNESVILSEAKDLQIGSDS